MRDRFTRELMVNRVVTGTEVYADGSDGINGIYYHEALGEGDRHYVDVLYETGKVVRIFNFAEIQWFEEGEEVNG